MLGIFYYAKQRVFSYRFNAWYKTVLQQLFSDHCNLEQKCKKSFHLYLNEHILGALTIEFLLIKRYSLCQKLVKFVWAYLNILIYLGQLSRISSHLLKWYCECWFFKTYLLFVVISHLRKVDALSLSIIISKPLIFRYLDMTS